MSIRLSLCAFALGVFTIAVAPAAIAQEETAMPAEQSILEMRGADVVAVFNGEKNASDVFGDDFLQAVSADQLTAMNAQLSAQFGAMISVESIEPVDEFQGQIAFRFERAIGRGGIAVSTDAPNKIVGLRLTSFEPIDDSVDKITTDIAALPGRVGVYFGPLYGSGEPLLSVAADEQFAIGSTFKLYVLSALTRSIAKGVRAWDDVVRLDTKSLPSGTLQDWPDGSPFTLHTLATLMISVSDNTATDQLIKEIGRDAVEAELRASDHSAPDGTLPFLTSLELFALKADVELASAYNAADESEQRRLLQNLATRLNGKPDRANAQGWSKPRMIDTLEWFGSAQDVRGIMHRLVDANDPIALSVMGVMKAMPPAMASKWDYVGYKGGSEPGVLNLSWLLRDKAGEWYVLAMSWNNTQAPVDQANLEMLSQRVLALADE